MVTTTPSALTQDEVLFNWALAEIHSPRWREVMRTGLSGALLAKLDQDAADFTETEKQALVGQIRQHRKDKIKGYISPFSKFVLKEIPVSELEKLPVSPQAGGWDKIVALGEFIGGKYSETNGLDPRNSAKHWLASGKDTTYLGYPIVSYSKKLACPVLIEGYTRCIAAILRHRNGESLPPIKAIYCAN